jgi:hypothetical protein
MEKSGGQDFQLGGMIKPLAQDIDRKEHTEKSPHRP